jgi:elongation factor G
MAKELEDDLIAPVTLGSAVHGHGVTRLLKLLRHEAPEPEKAAARLGVSESASAAAVIRTAFAPHVGKVSLVRIWRGALKDGASINRARVSGLFYPHGEERIRADVAGAGELAGIPRIDALEVGDWILDGTIEKRPAERRNGFLFAMAVRAKNDKEEVKLSTALQKLLEEDLSLSTERRADTGETVLVGRGDVHLRLAAAKLKSRYNVEVEMKAPKAAYRETIKGSADHHARHKKQSGGHGQFADIRVKIKPQSRGGGFKFDETIHGGSVPKQFIPAVESGVKEELASGPLGFPVVDVAVTLYDGQVHAVDSNEMSFKMAGRQAIREALPACQPVLLEPICATSVFSPSSHASKVRSVLSARRGQILGYGARDGWPGWESVNVMMPEAAMQDLIIELRSITQGAATFESKFDHYQEIQGKEADKIVQERRRELYG